MNGGTSGLFLLTASEGDFITGMRKSKGKE